MPGITTAGLVPGLHNRALESVIVEEEPEPAVAVDMAEALSKVATGSWIQI